MGADIHLYVEFKENGRDHWRSWGSRMNPGRYYSLFGKMAGVRSNEAPLFPLRGRATDASYYAQWDDRLFISKNDGDDSCTPENAEKWVASGSSEYVKDREGNNRWVTHPEWHSHSWLTTDEFEKVLSGYQDAREYWAVLAAMRELEKHDTKARIVFWFDN